MKLNKRIKYVCVAMLFPLLSFGQKSQLVGEGARMVINSGTVVTVSGGITAEEGFTFINRGTLSFGGDWANLSTQPVFSRQTGLVRLIGTDQLIGGSRDTHFSILILTGSGIKTLERSVQVSDSLHLHNAIVETLDNIIHLTNTSPEALQWETGYIQSNTLGGALSRSVKDSDSYLFPVGSDQLANNYRGVQIVPNNSDSAVYTVRLAGIDASFDQGTSPAGITGPFDLSATSGDEDLNDRFYHNIHQAFGNGGGQVSFFFFNGDNLLDEYNNVYEWNPGLGQWEAAGFSIENAPLLAQLGSPDRVATKDISNFNTDSFILGFTSEEAFMVPEIFTPDGDGINDRLEIVNLTRFPNNSLTVFTRWGDPVFKAQPYNNDWDGTFRSQELPDGTYYYILDLGTDMNLSGNLRKTRGFFQIKRN